MKMKTKMKMKSGGMGSGRKTQYRIHEKLSYAACGVVPHTWERSRIFSARRSIRYT